MGELIETNFKKSKNYFYELRNILKLNSHSNKFHGSLYEKQLVHDFIQLNSTCLAIQSIFPFFYAFLNLLDTLVTRASQIFARIRLPSLIQNFILLTHRRYNQNTMSTVHTTVWNLLCGEILISCFVFITWHEDRACRAENCFVFPKLFMANFRSLMKIRRNIALCFGEITRGASENLPEFDEISCEQLTKVSDFRFHYFCTTLCLYLHQK